MSDFKPLDMQRAIRDDSALTKIDKPFLWSAVLRTDNSTRRVRASLELLAKDAGFGRNTAYKVFADDNQPVMRYFEPPERSGRTVQLRWRSSVECTRAGQVEDPECTPGVQVEDVWAIAKRSSAHGVGTECTPDGHSVHTPWAPSASICSSSASTSHPDINKAPSFDDEKALDTATPAGPLPEEPVSQQGQAPETDVFEEKPCGCASGLSCPTCRGDVARPQKHPDFRLKGWHDDHLERDEGLNEFGEPIDTDY